MKDPLHLMGDFVQECLLATSTLLIILSVIRLSITGEGWDSLAVGLSSLVVWKLGGSIMTKMKEWDHEIAQRRLDEDDQDGSL